MESLTEALLKVSLNAMKRGSSRATYSSPIALFEGEVQSYASRCETCSEEAIYVSSIEEHGVGFEKTTCSVRPVVDDTLSAPLMRVDGGRRSTPFKRWARHTYPTIHQYIRLP